MPVGLCVGWLIAMGVEAVLSLPWLREAFGGLHWQLAAARCDTAPRPGGWRPTSSARSPWSSLIVGVGVWTSTRGGDDDPGPGSPSTPREPAVQRVPTCAPTAETGPAPHDRPQRPVGHRIDARPPLRSYDEVGALVTLAKAAGAAGHLDHRVVPDHAARPRRVDLRFEGIDRTIAAARRAGLEVRAPAHGHARLGARRARRHDAPAPAHRRRARRAGRASSETCMRHVDGKVDYVEVWNEPNDPEVVADRARTRSSSPGCWRRPTTPIKDGLAGDPGDQRRPQRQRHRLPREGLRGRARRSGSTASPVRQLGVHPFAGATPPDVDRPGQALRARPVRPLRRELHRASWRCTTCSSRTATTTMPDLHHPVRLHRPGHRRPRGGPRRDPGAATSTKAFEQPPAAAT